MVLSVLVLILLAAFAVTIAAGMGKAPLWIAVLLLAIAGLLTVLPAGR